jgi:tetratricopeptide (TPR) repeat protein
VLYESMGRHDDAEPLLTRALEMEEAGRVTERPQVLASLNNLAVLYFRTGRYGKAAELYKRALSNAPDIERPGILRCVEMNYAVLLARLGCTDGAVFFGKLAVNTIPGPPPAPADESASDAFELLSAGGENVYENLAGFLEKAGRPEETRRARELGERDKDALRVLNVSEEDENETPSSERMALTDSETKNWLRYDRGAQTLAKLRRERTELSEARERTTADDQRLALLGKEIRKADEAFREVIDDISGKFTGVGLRQTAHRAP